MKTKDWEMRILPSLEAFAAGGNICKIGLSGGTAIKGVQPSALWTSILGDVVVEDYSCNAAR